MSLFTDVLYLAHKVFDDWQQDRQNPKTAPLTKYIIEKER